MRPAGPGGTTFVPAGSAPSATEDFGAPRTNPAGCSSGAADSHRPSSTGGPHHQAVFLGGDGGVVSPWPLLQLQ
jgi:hypothetical protein